jgi:hypothetical protein
MGRSGQLLRQCGVRSSGDGSVVECCWRLNGGRLLLEGVPWR